MKETTRAQLQDICGKTHVRLPEASKTAPTNKLLCKCESQLERSYNTVPCRVAPTRRRRRAWCKQVHQIVFNQSCVQPEKMQGAGQVKSCNPSPTPPALWLAHLLVMILQTGNQLSLLATNFELALLQLSFQLRYIRALQCFRPCRSLKFQSKVRHVHLLHGDGPARDSGHHNGMIQLDRAACWADLEVAVVACHVCVQVV